ncbi:MAG: thioredoxin [Dehalococcoidia bacterium]|nr:thioredoxin [Dehalococcoidia bacterium]
MAKPFDVTEQSFDQDVLKSGSPVLVDFWAPWCAPCRHIAPIVEELSIEYDGKVAFAKVNTDEQPAIAQRYQIFSIPTLIIFKDGQPVKQLVGLRPKKDLKSNLDSVLV